VNVIATLLLWLWSVISYVPRQLVTLWPWRKPKLFHGIRVEELPEKLDKGKVYLAGEGEHLWAAAMVCPCGCGELIELNLLKQARPCWSVQEHADGTITLAPSVWRQKGCRSHFLLRRGRIDWC
jgi:Family of unknown function (DUF6527)